MKHISQIKRIADISKKTMIVCLITIFCFCKKTTFHWMISHISIFSGSRFLKFCKKGPIPSNVSIKLLTSRDVNAGVNLPLLKKPI